MDSKAPILRIAGLCHLYADGTPALDQVDLNVDPGEFLVVCGKNGSGKTTLLRHLNALLAPTSGMVEVGGRSAQKDPLHARLTVGMVFADADAQIVGETVEADVAFGPENLGLPREEINARVERALSDVGMWDLRNKRPHLLSGGQKRKLAVAGVLAMDPEVVAFDEPFSNLDYPGVEQVLLEMKRLHSGGRTLVVATHDLDKIASLAGRLVFMDRGRIMKDGPVQEILPHAERFGVRCPTGPGGEIIPWLR